MNATETQKPLTFYDRDGHPLTADELPGRRVQVMYEEDAPMAGGLIVAPAAEGELLVRLDSGGLVTFPPRRVAIGDIGFPLTSYREAARHMRRPFTPAAIKFKVQATWRQAQGDGDPTHALVVCYIDARLVAERLNLLLPDKWEDEYKAIDGNHLICRLTVDGISRRDIGEGTGKALWSDALKRAAVKFGIGVSCYAIPKMILTGEHVKLKKKTLLLTTDGEAHVRTIYSMWLERHGAQAFGEPLDHGDEVAAEEGPQGDWEADAATQAQVERGGEAPPALDDERATTQRTLAEELFAELREIDPKAMLGAQFDAYLVSAEHSHDKLDDFLTYLRGRVDTARAKKGADQ